MKEIIVTIGPDGSQVKTEVQGVSGPSCEDLTRGLLEALGDTTESEPTEEFYQEAANTLAVNT